MTGLARLRRRRWIARPGIAVRSFSLVEVLVVLGIVVSVAALILSAGRALSDRAAAYRTRSTLLVLDAAVAEWQVLANRELTWWQYGDPTDTKGRADVRSDTPEVFIINEVFDAVARSGDIRGMLAAGIDRSLVVTYRAGTYPAWIDTPFEQSVLDARFDGSNTYLDAWGTPIYAIHPGRTWSASDYWIPSDDDGSVRTYNELKYGIAPNRIIVFVSAGVDRRFGLDEEFPLLIGDELREAKREAREDNLYSRPVRFEGG